MIITANFKCFCGHEWSISGRSLAELIDEVAISGCPKHCTSRVIYMTGHESDKDVPLKQFIQHGLASFERF